jgi:hypothetical protein
MIKQHWIGKQFQMMVKNIKNKLKAQYATWMMAD